MTALVRLLAVLIASLGLSGAAATSRVAGGVSSIRITSATGVAVTVTRRSAVRQIVTWFDALPHFVARPCPYLVHQPPDVTFKFRGAGGGVTLHAVDHVPGTCSGSIAYGNDGQVKYAPLADDNFVARVSKLIGVNFDGSQTEQNKRAATRDVARILRLAIVPPGSHRVAAPPHQASPFVGVTNFADRNRAWAVPMSVGSVDAFEKAHLPKGSRLFSWGTSSDHGITSMQVTFSFPARPGISTRELALDISPMKSGGTRIDVDAEDVWVVARPVSDSVPRGVRRLVVDGHHVTNEREVRKIVRWFDALPTVQQGAFSCPMETYGPTVVLAFRSASGALLAIARMPTHSASGYLYSSRCEPILFRIGGGKLAGLVGGRFFFRVERLLGIHLP